MSKKLVVVAALALTGALGAGLAQARGVDVQWSVTIGNPIGGPVYSQPYPVYAEPAPVYRQPVPVYVQPVPMYRHQRQYVQATRWDSDGDGIPNRYDRVYNPPGDRDGDGIPNRYDRHDNRRHDRDGDGTPNWQDRHDGRGR